VGSVELGAVSAPFAAFVVDVAPFRALAEEMSTVIGAVGESTLIDAMGGLADVGALAEGGCGGPSGDSGASAGRDLGLRAKRASREG
jgi:hypothetical protein